MVPAAGSRASWGRYILKPPQGLLSKLKSGVVVQPEIEIFGVVDVLHPFDTDVDLVYGLEQVDVEAQRVALWIGV